MSEYVSEDIKERIKHYENKDRENRVKQEGYDAGFLNGKEMVLQKAQNAIDKIIRATGNGGLSMDELRGIFSVGGDAHSIFLHYTLRDIIEKFDKYDEQNEIHVGDEVVFDNSEKAVVTKIFSVAQRVIIMCSDGCSKCCVIDKIKKTGNHFPEVSKMLEALRGGETE